LAQNHKPYTFGTWLFDYCFNSESHHDLFDCCKCYRSACSFGWWLMAGLFREKSTAGWLLVADLF
jgi:hypothetical protein